MSILPVINFSDEADEDSLHTLLHCLRGFSFTVSLAHGVLRSEYTGELVEASDSSLTLEELDGNRIEIPYDPITTITYL